MNVGRCWQLFFPQPFSVRCVNVPHGAGACPLCFQSPPCQWHHSLDERACKHAAAWERLAAERISLSCAVCSALSQIWPLFLCLQGVRSAHRSGYFCSFAFHYWPVQLHVLICSSRHGSCFPPRREEWLTVQFPVPRLLEASKLIQQD